MAATIHDVAYLAELSLGTVSKYINGKPVKEANRIKIEKAIKKLNYRPNNIAKGLRNAKSFTVAVLVPMLSNAYCTTIISSIEKYLLPKGYSVIVSECHDSAEMELFKTEFLLDRMVDGIILLPYATDGKQLERIKHQSTPVVVIDQLIDNHEADSVVLDNENATYIPTEYLIKKGHREIAIITGSPKLYTSKGRINGYKKALTQYNINIKDEYIMNGEYTMAGGYEAVISLFDSDPHPTAVIASNYEMTIGSYLAINHLKLNVPNDVSIIGFDNLILSQVVSPPLTIVEQPMDEIGTSAAELLYKRMLDNYDNFPETIIHQASILLKESVKSISEE